METHNGNCFGAMMKLSMVDKLLGRMGRKEEGRRKKEEGRRKKKEERRKRNRKDVKKIIGLNCSKANISLFNYSNNMYL